MVKLVRTGALNCFLSQNVQLHKDTKNADYLQLVFVVLNSEGLTSPSCYYYATDMVQAIICS